jgi:hypothetical protein
MIRPRVAIAASIPSCGYVHRLPAYASAPHWRSAEVDTTRGQLHGIEVDLGIEELDGTDTRGTRRWRGPLRREEPDFYAFFAADGLRQLETYLAKRAARSTTSTFPLPVSSKRSATAQST